MKENVKAHLIVSGKVQGVWFRDETQKAAIRFRVNGWVRNRQDGSVEAVVEGEKRDVKSLINWCQTGSPLSNVAAVDVQWKAYRGEYNRFDVVY